MKVLFVDDEDRVLAALKRVLRPLRSEWHMDFVSSGQAALEALAADDYDIVVSDVRMPGIDGIELLDRVRQAHPDLVRVILSGHSDQVDTLRSTTVAHQYLAKPCDADVIKNTVASSTALRQELANPDLLAAIARTKSLPAAPSLYQQLTNELSSADPSMARVTDIVRQDPALTAKILQIVNSAFFSLRRRVADIEQAVNYLGVDTITALTLTTHLFSQGSLSSGQKSLVETVWHRSIGVATMAKAIATSRGADKGVAQEAFLAGMLHDAGRLVLLMNWPHQYTDVTVTIEEERSEFGADHALIGAYLLSMWGLPDEIVNAVAFHHEPARAPACDQPVLTAVHAAYALEGRIASPEFDNSYLESRGLVDEAGEWVAVAERVEYERENA